MASNNIDFVNTSDHFSVRPRTRTDPNRVDETDKGAGSFSVSALQRRFRAPHFAEARRTSVVVPELPWMKEANDRGNECGQGSGI